MPSGDETIREIPVLPIYVRVKPVPSLHLLERLFFLGISAGCLALLYIATTIRPDARGIGTHEQLGLPACGFVQFFGLPCPSCGFTTSFALFVRLEWWASFTNQPAGFALALAAATFAWLGLYTAATGKPAHRLFAPYLTPRNITAAILAVLLAWAWKIALVKVWP